MRKTTFLFFALLLMSIGVWAQTSVTSISADKVYTLECNAKDGHEARFINDDGTIIDGQRYFGTFFSFEPITGMGPEAYYCYIRSITSGKYINYNSTTQKICVEESPKTLWEAAKIEDANTMYFKVSGTVHASNNNPLYLNNNGNATDETCTNLQAKDHGNAPTNDSNGCSSWTVREYTLEEAYASIRNIYKNAFVGKVGTYTVESATALMALMIEDAETDTWNNLGQFCLDLGNAVTNTTGWQLIMPDPNKFYNVATWRKSNLGKLVFAGSDNKCYWGDNTTPAGVWVFEVDGDNYYMKNLATGSYTGSYAQTSDAIQLIDERINPVTMEHTGNIRPTVAIRPGEGARLNRSQNGGFPKVVCAWNESLTTNNNSGWLINEVDPSDIRHTLTIGETGWATLVLGFNATIPTVDGVKVYVVTETSTESATLQEVSGVLPANVAVLVSGTANSTVDFVCTSDAASGITSELRGTLYNKNITLGTSETCYVLAKPDGAEIPGFYKAELNQSEGTAFLNNANRAYLSIGVSGGAPARYLSFDFGTETGLDVIKGIESASTESVIYDLSGRRVRNAQKGMYIVNGNKVVK